MISLSLMHSSLTNDCYLLKELYVIISSSHLKQIIVLNKFPKYHTSELV